MTFVSQAAVFTAAFSCAFALSSEPRVPDPVGAEPSVVGRAALSRAFPASSFACVEFAGLASCRDAADRVDLLRIAERVGRQFDPDLMPPPLEHMIRELDGNLAAAGLDRATLRGMLGNGVAVGIGRPTLFDEDLVPSFAIAFDVGDEPEPARRAWRLLTGALERENGDELEFLTESLGDVTLDIVRARGRNGELASALAGDVFFVGLGSGYVRDCVKTALGAGESLQPALAAARGRVGVQGGELLSAFVNTTALEPLGDLLPYEVTDLLGALGLRGTTGIYFGTGVDASGSRDVLHVGVETSDEGLLPAMFGGRVTHGAARMLPENALFYGTVCLDWRAVADAVERFAASLPGEARIEFEREVRNELADELAREGVDVGRLGELMGRLGSQLTIGMPMIGSNGGIAQLVASVELADGDGFQDELVALCEGMEPPLKSARFRDHTLHYVSARIEGLSLSPAFTVVDDRLLIASDVRALKRSLARLAGDESSLADTESFRSATAAVDGAFLFTTVRVGDNVRGLWQMALPQAERMLESQLGMDPDTLPSTDELERALGNAVTAVRLDGDGLGLVSTQPLGLGTLLAAVGKYADLVLEADVHGRREKAAPKKKGKRKIY